MTNIEVLSPVGSEEMLLAAVRSGADAVYLGAGDFNARRSAANFDDQQLKKAIEYCRVRDCKVYLTLNILIRDDEIKKALDLARRAFLMGIDGIIVQDLGLARLLKDAVPQLPLHASTQLSVHSVSALAPLKELGFCRVVAAREMSFGDLEALCKEAKRLDMEIEVFVHGALCMCVSGQCMLSSMLGTRSGNRGLCAGPCRLPFTARGKNDDYALSLKDLSLIEHMDKLKEIGVASLKIEGRLKRPEYVAAATAAVSAAAKGEPDSDLNVLLYDVFSRSGFTDGYFTDKVDTDMFGVRTKEDMERSKAALPIIHSLYRSERQRIGVDITARILRDNAMELTLSDGVNTITCRGEEPQIAKNRAADEASVKAALEKLGGTPFYPRSIKVTLDEGLFISNAALNELRRNAADMLAESRGRISVTAPEYSIPEKPTNRAEQTKYIISVTSLSQLEGIEFTPQIKAVIVPLEKAAELSLPKYVEKYVDIPRGIENEEKISALLLKAKAMGFVGAVCGNIAAIPLAGRADLKIIAGQGMNIYNSFTAQQLADMGAQMAVISPEMHLRHARDIAGGCEKIITVYGKLPLMLLKNCPVKAQIGCKKCGGNGALTDRMGKVFPVKCRMGFSELFNCVPLCLDKLKDFAFAHYALICITDEDKTQAANIVSGYIDNKIQTPDEFTRGLYFRNVE